MKKSPLTAALMTLFAIGFFECSASACDRVIYSGSRVVYTTPIVYSTPATPVGTAIHTTPIYSSAPAPVNPLQSTTGTFRVTQVIQKVVAPVVVEKQEVLQVVEKMPEITHGSTLHAKVRLAGYQAGEVTVTSGGGLEVQCEIVEWTPNLVTFRMPNLQIVRDVEIEIRITAADRTPVKSLKAILVTGSDLTIEPPTTTLAQQ